MCLAGLVHRRGMGEAVLTAPGKAVLYFTWEKEGLIAWEKLAQQKLVQIDYLITNKHSTCFFIFLCLWNLHRIGVVRLLPKAAPEELQEQEAMGLMLVLLHVSMKL